MGIPWEIPVMAVALLYSGLMLYMDRKRAARIKTTPKTK